MKNWFKNTKLGNFILLMFIVILTCIIMNIFFNGSILNGCIGGGIVAIYYSFFKKTENKFW